jgi:F-type H+-transporting ATPase subunit delta
VINTKISIRYALSLLAIANEKGNLNTLSEDMELILSAINSSSDLRVLLASPVVKLDTKKLLFENIFKSRISSDSLNFIKFIAEKGRENLLQDIIMKFLNLKDEQLGIVNVDVHTAYDFSDEERKKFKEKLEDILKKEVKSRFITDRSIIGGFTAKVGDTVFDASLKHQLELLKNQFLKGSLI